MRILSAGESDINGPARYLLAVLHSLKAEVTHLPPSKQVLPHWVTRSTDAVILSDCARRQMPATTQKRIRERVDQGMGLLMIGGWASFTGQIGGWHGSVIESVLPVRCIPKDDRCNFPSGALIIEEKRHPMFRGFSFSNPPSVCGLNRVEVKPTAHVILSARPIESSPGKIPNIRLSRSTYPLLIVDGEPKRRVAALTTDVAPHWSGGLVDWGLRRVTLKPAAGVSVEVGDRYVCWLSGLIRWLACG